MRIGILSSEGMRQGRTRTSIRAVLFECDADPLEMTLEQGMKSPRQKRDAILSSFPISNSTFSPIKRQVLDPECKGFTQPSPRTVEQSRDEAIGPMHGRQKRLHLRLRQDGWKTCRTTDAFERAQSPEGPVQDGVVEKDDCVEAWLCVAAATCWAVTR